MEIALLILFFILFLIFAIYSKSDLYAHEHDASIRNEIKKFNSNYKELENLDIEESYFTENSHIYKN